jgi:GMP synthase-like glutamine amidotransferase
MKKKNILVFKHMPSQNPGIFRDFAESQDVEFIEIDLHAGDRIPELSDLDGLWVMGGSMNVWEEEQYPWLVEEKQVIRRAVNELNMPFLGICLGHQLLAEAMGGKVAKTENYEIGLFEVSPTDEGLNHPLLHDIPSSSQWVNVHLAEVVRAPEQAVILATSSQCQNHIMQIGKNAYSCQFHPEVCDHTLEEWMKIPGIPEALDGLLGSEGLAYFEFSIKNNLPANNAASSTLFRNWCGLVFD